MGITDLFFKLERKGYHCCQIILYIITGYPTIITYRSYADKRHYMQMVLNNIRVVWEWPFSNGRSNLNWINRHMSHLENVSKSWPTKRWRLLYGTIKRHVFGCFVCQFFLTLNVLTVKIVSTAAFTTHDISVTLHHRERHGRRNRMAWQWAETLVEISGTLADIRGTTK